MKRHQKVNITCCKCKCHVAGCAHLLRKDSPDIHWCIVGGVLPTGLFFFKKLNGVVLEIADHKYEQTTK